MNRTQASPAREGSARSIIGYGSVAMAIHWLTVALVVVAFIMGPGGSEQRVYSAANDFQREIHEVLGLTVFALTVLRFVWRALAPAPTLPPAPGWMEPVSRIVQGLLYALLFATPMTAVAGAWLEGHPLTLGLLGNVPPMIPETHAAGRVVAEVHTFLGDTILWLAGLHAAAALFHHFVLRDAVLLSMVPQRWRRALQDRSSCS
jgi:cytochrome b561